MMLRYWLCAAICLVNPCFAAETVRVASFNTELERKGPGLLLRDIDGGKDPQVAAVVEVIAMSNPDIIALQSIDWDYENAALSALSDALAKAGAVYPYQFAIEPNAGRASGLDLDGDGRLGEPEDSHGFGYFTGQGGIAVLSRYPILFDEVQDFTAFLWADLPGALLPVRADGSLFPSPGVYAHQRLSSTGHWVIPIALPNGKRLTLLTFKAGPPVFDGPEDRNGRRNHDEIAFWTSHLDGKIGTAPKERFVIAGDSNLDPDDSEGLTVAMRHLLSDARLTDPAPSSEGARTAPDQGHKGPNALDTVDWDGPGRLRVDYVLPSRDWQIANAGVLWPAPQMEAYDTVVSASRHRLVWVDLVVD